MFPFLSQGMRQIVGTKFFSNFQALRINNWKTRCLTLDFEIFGRIQFIPCLRHYIKTKN